MNEGQTQYNQALAKRLGEWIGAHPAGVPATLVPEKQSTAGIAMHSVLKPIEGIDLLGDGAGSGGSAVSGPIAILALSNIVALALLIWFWNAYRRLQSQRNV